MKNLYQTLGINREASNEEIKKAYLKLAQKFHPDKNNGDDFFEERFKEINDAYEVLSNSFKKVRYDKDFDDFYRRFKKTNDHNENKSYNNAQYDYEDVRKEKEKNDNKIKESEQKEKDDKIKKNAELQFEDKAWIFIGNWFLIPGAVGLFMFIKYRNEGFIKKSNSVCSLTLISFFIFLFIVIIFALVQEASR